MTQLKKNTTRKKMANTKNRNALSSWYKGGNRQQARSLEYERVGGDAWWVTRYLQANVPLTKYVTYKDKRE